MSMERSTVVGVFEQRARAEECVDELRQKGFNDDQIGFAMRGEHSPEGIAEPSEGHHAGAGLGAGLAGGAGVGAIAGAILTGLIPGIGPILAGGILVGILGGAAAGAAAGGLIGALTGMGVPEHEAEYYNTEFESGRAIVTVKAGGRYAEAEAIVRRFGGRSADSQAAVQTNTPGRASSTGQTVQLREEELRATKTQTQAGEVEVGKKVVTEQKSMDVPVTHEEIEIERHAVDRRPATGNIDETANDTVRVPLMEEQIEVEKRPVVTEEINVRKTPVTETQQVSDTVRREEADIQRQGDTTAGTTPHEHNYVDERCAICGAPRSEHRA